MSLCDRLQKRTPCGYGTRFFFEFKGDGYFDKAQLIFLVVERFAERYGALTESNANPLYERLAKKYCFGIGWRPCFRSLEIKVKPNAKAEYFAHPKGKKDETNEIKRKEMEMQWFFQSARSQVERESRFLEGARCALASTEWSGYRCRMCCGVLCYVLFDAKGRRREVCRGMNGAFGICRNAMCKALVQVFPTCISSRKKLPMANVLMELTKNGDRSGKVREIEKIASRDIYKTHNRRNRQKTSTDSSASCA